MGISRTRASRLTPPCWSGSRSRQIVSTITFVLSGPGPKPIGGNKIIFEYANRFARAGHAVHIVFPSMHLAEEQPFFTRLGMALRYPVLHAYRGGYAPDGWFPLDKRVQLHWVRTLAEANIPDSDAVIATACETAEPVASYSGKKGRKFYFLQHFEDWNFSPERVRETWKLPLRKIVIAKWLQSLASELGQPSDLVYNGLNFDDFGVDVPIEQKDKRELIILYHTSEWKGSRIGLEALELVRAEEPEAHLTVFSATRKPSGFPDHVEYHYRPDPKALRALYNRAAIYLGTSFTEGWGLTLSEAMQCGSALACTDIPGYEIAIEEETALKSPPGDAAALAQNILRLMREDALRARLAHAGNALIQNYTWDRAYRAFSSALFGPIEAARAENDPAALGAPA